jgi:hypothetical protein
MDPPVRLFTPNREWVKVERITVSKPGLGRRGIHGMALPCNLAVYYILSKLVLVPSLFLSPVPQP